MTEFVESLKRLYICKKVTYDILKRLLNAEKISGEEFKYIIRKDGEE